MRSPSRPARGPTRTGPWRRCSQPYYREGLPSPRVSRADFALSLAGAIVVHAAEMAGWRKSDIEDRESTLTRCIDHGRRAYGYEARDYPRRACLAFSVNDVDFLQDTSRGSPLLGPHDATRDS